MGDLEPSAAWQQWDWEVSRRALFALIGSTRLSGGWDEGERQQG